MPRVRFLWVVPIRGNLSHCSTELNIFTAPEKKCSWLHLSARLSAPQDPSQFLSQPNHWSNALKPNIYWRQTTLVYWANKYQYAIGMFNICSRGPTYQSLIDTGGGYNLVGADFPYHSLWPSQPTVLHFLPNGTTRFHIIHPNITNWIKEGTNSKSREWDFSTRLLSWSIL
jgi:hypothetical protein